MYKQSARFMMIQPSKNCTMLHQVMSILVQCTYERFPKVKSFSHELNFYFKLILVNLHGTSHLTIALLLKMDGLHKLKCATAGIETARPIYLCEAQALCECTLPQRLLRTRFVEWMNELSITKAVYHPRVSYKWTRREVKRYPIFAQWSRIRSDILF